MAVCREDQIVNPATGRCVSKTGPIGKKLLGTPKTPKPKTPKPKTLNCPEDKILNPATGRCVSKTGPIGKKLLGEENPVGRPKKYEVKDDDTSTYNIKEGVMMYKELRPRQIESDKQRLKQYTGYYVSIKYDGWQAVWDGKGGFQTKTGKRSFKAPEEWGKLLPEGISIAGELIIEGKQATDVAALTTAKGDWSNVKFMAFDIPGMKGTSFKVRTEVLESIVQRQCRKFPKCPMIYVDQTICGSVDKIYRKWKNVLSKGGEGLVLTDPDSKYNPMKRTDERVKLKGREDTEGKITGFNLEKGQLKSIILKTSNGKSFNLGIGFSNEERKNYDKIFKKGENIKFSYRSLTADGKPKEARFLGKRHIADML